jgi:hypothetical protein
LTFWRASQSPHSPLNEIAVSPQFASVELSHVSMDNRRHRSISLITPELGKALALLRFVRDEN